jgi:hypothetical protein
MEGKRRELMEASPDYKTRLRVQDADPDAVRKALPAGAVLIEFRQFQPADFRTGELGEPRFAGLLLTGSQEPVVMDLGPVSEVQSLTTAMGASVPPAAPDRPEADRGLTPDPAGAPLSLTDQAAARLHERLFAPFGDAVASANAVYIAPDGILNLVPFARLKLPDGHYWFEQQEVHTLQTGRDLLRPKADRPARGLLALGGIDFGAAPAPAAPQDSLFRRSDAVGRAAKAFPTFNPLPVLRRRRTASSAVRTRSAAPRRPSPPSTRCRLRRARWRKWRRGTRRAAPTSRPRSGPARRRARRA